MSRSPDRDRLVPLSAAVPAHDNEASARFFAHIFGLQVEATVSHFAPVRVNDTLVLDFDTGTTFEPHHYAFRVSDPDFDTIFQRIEREGIAYGSGPRSPYDMTINRRDRNAPARR